MKQKLHSALGIIIVSLLLASCKLDAPIYPDDPDFVPYNSTGGNGGGSTTPTIDVALLTGNWEVTATYIEIYNSSGGVISSMMSAFNLYSGVELNNTGRNFLFSGSFQAPDPGTYTTSNSGNSVYIQLSADPFGRTSNAPIQITSVNATSMTWIALEPIENSTPGGVVKTGYRVVYTRRP